MIILQKVGFLLKFSERLNEVLGDNETGIWNGEWHTGLAYIQQQTSRKSRVLLPLMCYLSDGSDYDSLGLSLYVGSDGEVFGLSSVEVFIAGRWYVRGEGKKRQIVHLENPKNFFLCEPTRSRWLE